MDTNQKSESTSYEEDIQNREFLNSLYLKTRESVKLAFDKLKQWFLEDECLYARELI